MANEAETAAVNVATEAQQAPAGGAGVVYDARTQCWEVWAFGLIVWRVTNLLYLARKVPLQESFEGAAKESDEELRHLKCATIALDGMNDVGGWRFYEVPREFTRFRYPFPPGLQAECEIRRARVAGYEFAVGRAPEIRTVFYHAPRLAGYEY